jgi:mRNA interferase RelE/StbE
MGYNAVYFRDACKFLGKQPDYIRKRIMDAIDKLPLFGDVKPLKGRAGYRLRVGDIRVIYQIDNDNMVVEVMDIGYRGNIY